METTKVPDLQFNQFINSIKGCFSAQQSVYLRDLAAKAGYGWIVEVGSFQGKSAVALWTGSKKRLLPSEPAVYCVEPHAKFEGIYGGEFGPQDRKAFFENMIKTGAYEGVALLNQSSETLGPGWNRPISLLVIDGDHTYEGVKRDFESWEPHVVPGGRIVFDDAADPEIGPYHLVREVLDAGGYTLENEFTKLVTLRKNFQDAPPPESRPAQKLKILVACTRLSARGGFLRFERVAKSLMAQGHTLTFATLGDEQDESWRGSVPVINIADAFNQPWDVTMIPGAAGFASAKTRSILESFRQPNFGLRVQHVLNDKTKEEKFKTVNYSFRPHLVLFNNHHWKPGDYTQFQANQFKTLVGGVDLEAFSTVKFRAMPCAGEEIWIGAQSQKNPEVLLSILEILPTNYRMKVFGPLDPLIELGSEWIEAGRLELVGYVDGNDLAKFYNSVDIVVSVEGFAGWTNVGAEALASGKPLVCSTPGTLSFAENRETALVINQLDPVQYASRIQELVENRELCEKIRFNGRKRIVNFDWKSYSNKLLDACYGARQANYFHAPELNLFGKWPLAVRLSGLRPLLSTCTGKTILDLGAAEGAIALNCLNAGGASVHGFELDEDRVQTARRICAQHDSRTVFRSADLNQWQKFTSDNGDVLRDKYDVVCYLGVHHHLNPETRNTNLKSIMKMAKEQFVIRTPEKVFELDCLEELIGANGFEPTETFDEDKRTTAGGLKFYRRVENRCQFVSFPKSGRTWLRYALHQLGATDEIKFHHDHFEFNSPERTPHDFGVEARKNRYSYRYRIVYLERNPLDVMASFYHQITGRFNDYHHYQGGPSEFIRDPYFGADILKRYQNTWNQLSKMEHVLKVTYEDCHRDFEGTLKKILEHFEFSVDNEEIKHAAKSSTFESMQQVESAGEFPHPWLRNRNGAKKVRSGRVGGYQNLFTQQDIEYLNSVFK